MTELICDEISQEIIDIAEKIALEKGAEEVNVRRILQRLNITNRVFYNRFHNIHDVLDIVYKKTIMKIRESIISKFDPEGDFFEQVKDIVVSTLKMSYENKMNFNQYVFENDSSSQENYEWWIREISSLIEFGKSRGILKNINTSSTSYAIWCFIRGYNADAVGRKLPLDEAIKNFKYTFGLLLDGMKN